MSHFCKHCEYDGEDLAHRVDIAEAKLKMVREELNRIIDRQDSSAAIEVADEIYKIVGE